MELETVESNPIRDISKRKTIKKIRELLSDEEREKIDKYLKPNFYTFWRFINIFFHSGARENEMLNLQAKDVDLEKHRFKILIKKGSQKREVYRTIKDVALPLWIELLKDAKPEDYLFRCRIKTGIEENHQGTNYKAMECACEKKAEYHSRFLQPETFEYR